MHIQSGLRLSFWLCYLVFRASPATANESSTTSTPWWKIISTTPYETTTPGPCAVAPARALPKAETHSESTTTPVSTTVTTTPMLTTTLNPCAIRTTTPPDAYLVFWDASNPDKKNVAVLQDNGKVGETMRSETTTTSLSVPNTKDSEKTVHGGLTISGIQGAPARNFQTAWSTSGGERTARKFIANTSVDAQSSTFIAWLPQAACLGTFAALLSLLVVLWRRLIQKPEHSRDADLLIELEGGGNDPFDEEATQTLLAARVIRGCS